MIEVESLSKRFGSVRAVDDLSFRAAAGTVTGFLGPNGAGKSTTLRSILGLVRPDSGDARVLGRPYAALERPTHHVGAILEASEIHPGRSGRNHLRVLAHAAGIPRTRVEEVLRLVELEGAANRRAGGYSLGMRQRLGLATALLGDPEVLIADEPANGLDPQGIRWLRDFLRSLAAEGRTVLVSSHVLSEVAQTADEVVIIARGKLVLQGPMAEVLARASGATRVRSPDAARLRGLLEQEGASVEEGGDRVLLVDERHRIDDPPEDVTALPRTTALGLYDDGYVVALERAPDLERLWHVRAGRVILATGATERPIAFAGNDRPGVMLASAAVTYLERFGVLAGGRAVLVTANDGGLAAADQLRRAGVDIIRRIGVGGDLSGVADEAEVVLVSGGWNPNLGLWRAIGGTVRYDERRACFRPADGPDWLEVVGRADGDWVPPGEGFWLDPSNDYTEHFVDLQRDQTVADIAGALDAGLTSVEHVKRATYIGTAIDQGRTSGMLAAAIVNELLGAGPDAQGPTSARPPAVPVSYATIAGPDRGELLDPVRVTRIHPWHVEHGAVFEDVGQWKRPRYFPRAGEGMDEAVVRECLAVRNAAGALDASTLGKIEVVGPDAAAFLDRMYTNRMSTLPFGSIRYGFMLGLDGMVVDDGVAMRLGDDRFFVTTTTGNAAMVLDRFEEWLQTEWPDLRVYCTSVTEQWADVAIAGPKAREVLASVGTDLDLSSDAFPFMTFRDGSVAGNPARVARVSFTGELSYEVLVDARRGLQLWDAVMRAGEPFGITPYGTEAMHVLRAEKGFVIVGQDTDGTVTPQDLGMGWIVRKDDSDFIGRRSLRRPDTSRPDRKQLVGLLPAAPLPEGAHLVEEDTGRTPMPMIGHVTSSYLSPSLARPIALAMIELGRERHGQTVFAPLPEGTIAAEVVPPVFYDPDGTRRDG